MEKITKIIKTPYNQLKLCTNSAECMDDRVCNQNVLTFIQSMWKTLSCV